MRANILREATASWASETEYRDRALHPGSFMRCAVTGVPIRLEDLLPWSVDFQELHARPEARLPNLGITSESDRGITLAGRPIMLICSIGVIRDRVRFVDVWTQLGTPA